ncbi:MAG: TetR/AcrR family transcriptional regulator [Clostridiales bacterium]|nr:TetR/AcrR family transcriptional regulator [Clostridiales bacterium]
MESILQSMDPQKKGRLINAAIHEFSLYPYEKASTNNIVRKAEISKGLLFHYFGSKKELYDWLVGFVLTKLFRDIASQIDWNQQDIFLRIKALVILKMKMGQDYPHMFDFVIKVLSQSHTTKMEDVNKLYDRYGIQLQTTLGDIYAKNIDFSRFRDQQATRQSINIIRWTMEKYSEESLLTLENMQSVDYEKISADLDSYITLLKTAFYQH